MDPRHPENAIWRMRQLMDQFQFVLDKLNNETVSSKLGEAEREGSLVVQEICLVAPRLHEAMMQTSRQRRHELSHGIILSYTPEEKVGKCTKATIGIEEKPVEKPVEKLEGYTETAEVLDHSMTKEQEQIFEEMTKPKKKTTRKKKTTKKAKQND